MAAILFAGFVASCLYWLLTDIASDAKLCLVVSSMLAAFFSLLMHSWAMYDPRHLLAVERQAKWVAVAWLASFGLVLGVAFLLKSSADLSRGAISMFALCGLVALIGHRLVWRRLFSLALAKGLIRRRRVFLLSFKPWSEAAGQFRLLRRAGVDLVARQVIATERDSQQAMARVLATARRTDPDEIIILAFHDDLDRMDGLVADLRALPLPIRLMPDPILSRLSLQTSSRLGTCALVDMARQPLTPAEQAFKRAFDVAVAALGLLAAAPLLLSAMAAVRLETPGPMLFQQSRRGFNGQTFRILKLRTMRVLEDGGAVMQAKRGDPRVTHVGAWLRRTSIDELPQLWNVLRGDMAIVGPRPHAVAHDDHYSRQIENYAFRHHVKPGITGWAQVNGHRGETPDVAAMAARIEHDLWYVNNWSVRVDLRIVFMTVTRLLAPTAY